jgi:hypothetical protein
VQYLTGVTSFTALGLLLITLKMTDKLWKEREDRKDNRRLHLGLALTAAYVFCSFVLPIYLVL